MGFPGWQINSKGFFSKSFFVRIYTGDVHKCGLVLFSSQTETNVVRWSLNAPYCNDLLAFQLAFPGLSMADIWRSIFVLECHPNPLRL